MQFSETSDITIVVTSCGRFDLLKKTLESLDRYNTAPIRAVIFTEDSGDEGVWNAIPPHWADHTQVFINHTKLGQLASIDLAYASVETAFVFHCEDDWEFYRPGFIEDSKVFLEQMPSVLQVWLRSFAHDVRVNYPFHSLGERFVIAGRAASRILSSEDDWQGFSFNPGLRRLADYGALAPFSRFATSPQGESGLSREYAQKGFFAVALEADAVVHIGDGAHVWSDADKQRKQAKSRRKRRRYFSYAGAFLLGVAIGCAVMGAV
jgi:hypothetical protein